MTSTAAAQIGSTDWDLVDMDSNGDQCFHCGKVRLHTAVVRNAVDGRERVICFACCLAVTGQELDQFEAARLLEEAARLELELAAEAAEFSPRPSLFIVELDGPTISAAEHYEYLAETAAELAVERWFESRGFWAARAQEAWEMAHGIC
jgi:hypothetical protein